MMECRDTGLPMNEPEVFKAFCAWRTNAKEFAKTSHLNEDYPVEVAQIVNAANPNDTELMKLAMLMSVPEAAWSVMEKRFGKETVEKLDEAWKHVRTGYNYISEADDDIQGLALAAGIKAFDKFIRDAEKLGETAAMGHVGKDPHEIISQIVSPECKMYERLAGKISGTKYGALEELFAEKLAAYKEARQQQNAELEQMGAPLDEDDVADQEIQNLPFEAHGLFDAPEVRQAYELLMNDTRVDYITLADALSVGRLLTELPGPKDAAAIAGGMIDAGLPSRNPIDNDFLSRKFDENVMEVLSYDIKAAYTVTSDFIKDAPPPVLQLVVASAVVALDMARKRSEGVMEYIANRSMSPTLAAHVKAEQMEPLQQMATDIPDALAPILGWTGAPELEQIYHAELKEFNDHVSAHTPKQRPRGQPVPIRFRPGKLG